MRHASLVNAIVDLSECEERVSRYRVGAARPAQRAATHPASYTGGGYSRPTDTVHGAATATEQFDVQDPELLAEAQGMR